MHANDRVFDKLYKYEVGLFNGDPNAIDAIIDFINVDITAFRTGYAKEQFLSKLKSLPLSEHHKNRLRGTATEFCLTKTFRREFRYLVRAVIPIANIDFVHELQTIEREKDGIIRFKTELMLRIILENRKDLRHE